MAEQSITILSSDLINDSSVAKRWDIAAPVTMDSVFVPVGANRTLSRVLIRGNLGLDNIQVRLYFSDVGTNDEDLAPEWEVYQEALTFTQGTDSVNLPGPGHSTNTAADPTDAYQWSPPSSIASAVRAFFFPGLDTSADWTITFRIPDPPPVTDTAPFFADETGDAQSWTVGSAITPITVPAATGHPTPTYSVFGSLPAGISFNTASRVISGTPTAAGSGTITIEARNSEGFFDWTVAYTTTAVPPTLTAPSFTDDTGNAQSWTQNTAITSLAVPAASGNPTPTYAAVGAIPAGIAFNTTTRVISGTPTAVSSGTITIRATNSEGSDDWTVSYTTSAAVVSTGRLEWQVRIDWDNAGDYSHSEADVTSRIISSISAERGPNVEDGRVHAQTPGRISFTLNNESGDYSYYNTASPLHGLLRPGCLVNLRSTWQGVTRNRGTGYLSLRRPGADTGGLPFVDIEAQGFIAYMNQAERAVSYDLFEFTGGVIEAVVEDEFGQPSNATWIEHGQTRVGDFFIGETRASEILRRAVATEAGEGFEATDGRYQFRGRHHRLLNSVSQAILSDSAGSGKRFVSDIREEDPFDTIYSVFRATANRVGESVLYTQFVYELPTPVEVGPLEMESHTVNFEPNDSYDAVTGFGLDDVIVAEGTTSSSPHVDSADYAIRIGSTTQTSATIQIENLLSQTVFLVGLTVTGELIPKLVSLPLEYVSEALVALVGPRAYPISLSLDSVSEARLWMLHNARLSSQQGPSVTVTLPAFRDDAHVLTALTLDITDRVTLDFMGPTMAGLSGDAFITSIADDISEEGFLTTAYTLVSSEAYDDFAIVGQARVGQNNAKVSW